MLADELCARASPMPPPIRRPVSQVALDAGRYDGDADSGEHGSGCGNDGAAVQLCISTVLLSRDSERRRTETGRSPMNTVISADGTAIAFDRFGAGPPVIMTVGAFNTRSTTEPLARALQERLTVLNYDRRGRGDSGDTAPYAVDREIEDIAALIGRAGGSASVFGYSSGATLALRAAASGLPIRHLVLYEPPFNTDDSYPPLPAGFAAELADLVTAGKRGDAVELYQTQA